MRQIRKPVAILAVAAILYSIFSVFGTVAYAAFMPVTITVDDFSDGTLAFSWSGLTGARSAEIIYHRPGAGGTAIYHREVVTSGNSFSISGLQADYIYDISVTLYNDIDPAAGDVIGRGLLYYLPAITFIASAPSQPYEDIEGGGREIGGTPKLRLNWKQPRIYFDPDFHPGDRPYPQDDPDTDNGKFIEANSDEALQYM
ncbi:MAG: fibronectin type III domain-containing protein, partial [Acetivibrionales bacterium]